MFGDLQVLWTGTRRLRAFVEKLNPVLGFAALSVSECLMHILRHLVDTGVLNMTLGQPGVCIIGFDKLIRSEWNSDSPMPDEVVEKLIDSISAIGELMNSSIDIGEHLVAVIPIISSLSQLLVNKAKTSSGRDITWIPLPPLGGVWEHVCRALRVDDERIKQSIRILCDYLGEHGRLIECLVRILKTRLDELKDCSSVVRDVIIAIA